MSHERFPSFGFNLVQLRPGLTVPDLPQLRRTAENKGLVGPLGLEPRTNRL
jgi:hypothetical protein